MTGRLQSMLALALGLGAAALAGSDELPVELRPPGADAPDVAPALRRVPPPRQTIPLRRTAPERQIVPLRRTTPAPQSVPAGATLPPATAAPPARAQPVGVPPATEAAGSGSSFMKWMDGFHENVQRRMGTTVERFDRFFGDEQLDEDNRSTRVRCAIGLKMDADEGLSFENRFTTRLALPHLENRLQIVADNLVNAEDPQHPEGIEDAAKKSKPDAGLRYIISEDETRRLSADAGARLGGSPQIFGKLRGRIVVPVDPWELRLIQTLQWYSHDGWGETTEMRWSLPLSTPGWLFQASTRLGWREDRSGVTPSQSFTWQFSENGEWGERFTVSAEWPETPSTTEAAYAVEYGYRRLIHSNWLFVEVTPGVDFSQVRDYEPNGFVTCLLEVSFDHRPYPAD